MPVFQTLYDVPSTGLAGASTTMMEVRPGIFYGLSLYANGIAEGSVWAVTSSGKLGIIYSAYPPNSTPGSLVQAPDGTVWTDYYEAINFTWLDIGRRFHRQL